MIPSIHPQYLIALLIIAIIPSLIVYFVSKRTDRQLSRHRKSAQRLRELEGTIASYETERIFFNEHLIEAIITLDCENKIISLNRSAKKLLNLAHGANGRSLAEIIREPELHEMIAQAKEQGLVLTGTMQLHAIDSVNVLTKILPMENGGVMVTLLDRWQLTGLDERHDDFIAHASHELKTPIAIILANAELLLDASTEDGNSRLLHAIHRQALRAKDLLESLLDLLRLNAGHYSVKLEEVELHQFVANLKDALGHLGVIIKNDVAREITVRTDRGLFERLTHIIVENAQKYAGCEPRLVITALRHDDLVKIQFADNGPGIKHHLRERVFEQFFRQPEHEHQKEGFGLGLSHARAIATSLGGKIFVDDNHGHGCSIAVVLDANSTRNNVN